MIAVHVMLHLVAVVWPGPIIEEIFELADAEGRATATLSLDDRKTSVKTAAKNNMPRLRKRIPLHHVACKAAPKRSVSSGHVDGNAAASSSSCSKRSRE